MEDRLGDGMGGAVVQRMAAPGVETIVGVTQDPSFGPLVLFGSGGVTAELLADRTLRLVPMTDVDAHEVVRSLRGSPLLFGYRGQPEVDVAALEDLLLRVARLADEIPEVSEMDLNPVIVSVTGAVAVDVKIRIRPADAALPAGPPPACGCDAGTDRTTTHGTVLPPPGPRNRPRAARAAAGPRAPTA